MPHTTHRHSQTVAIVGAGASGTLVATNLLRQAAEAGTTVDIRLIDPAPTTGRGVAYSTSDEAHLLNVPAGKMSALPDCADHFLQWLTARHGVSDPATFVPRAWYGDYLADTLAEAAAESGSSVRRVHEEAVEIHDRGADYTVRLSGGHRFRASHVVLALGSPKAGHTWVPTDLCASDRFVADPWDTEHLADVTSAASSILLVGTGLTMVDVAITLAAPGRVMHAVSRHGLAPRAHAVVPATALPAPEVSSGPLSLDEVRAIVAQQVATAVAAGASWRAGIDSLRPVTNELWSRLNPTDKAEFLATDMRRWEVARHRMSPASAALLDEMITTGDLRLTAGQVVGASTDADGVTVNFSEGATGRYDAVVDCTGPATVSAASGTGGMLLANLFAEGLAAPHRLGLGLATDLEGHLIARHGRSRRSLLAVGPLRRGALWETTAIPEIRVQAHEVAADIIDQRPRRSADRMPRDLYDLELSASPDAADLFNEALGRVLRVQSGAVESLQEAVQRDPDFALAHAALGVLGHEFDLDVDVELQLRRAQGLVERRGTSRERAFVAAYSARMTGDSAPLLAYLDDHPDNVLALAVAMPTIAFSGAYAIPEQAWAQLESFRPRYGDDWWYCGLLAFARQEQGRMAEATSLADHSLSIEPRGGTAVHARAHVNIETGNHASGLAWLGEWIDTCGRDATHRAHFSWHAALHELALDDPNAVVRRYHRQLAPPAVVGTRAMVDSATLLWRLQIEDAPVIIPLADPIVDVAGPELRRPQTAFAAMNAAFTWAASGDRSALGHLGGHCRASDDVVVSDTIGSLIVALDHYLAGRFSAAADTLLALRPTMTPVGGSDAQRAVVEDTAIAALIQAGRGDEAATLLEARMNLRARPRDRRLHARAVMAGASGRH